MISEVKLEKEPLLVDDANSTDDLTPQQLSGDENTEKSLLMSDITGSKSSTCLLTRFPTHRHHHHEDRRGSGHPLPAPHPQQTWLCTELSCHIGCDQLDAVLFNSAVEIKEPRQAQQLLLNRILYFRHQNCAYDLLRNHFDKQHRHMYRIAHHYQEISEPHF